MSERFPSSPIRIFPPIYRHEFLSDQELYVQLGDKHVHLPALLERTPTMSSCRRWKLWRETGKYLNESARGLIQAGNSQQDQWQLPKRAKRSQGKASRFNDRPRKRLAALDVWTPRGRSARRWFGSTPSSSSSPPSVLSPQPGERQGKEGGSRLRPEKQAGQRRKDHAKELPSRSHPKPFSYSDG